MICFAFPSLHPPHLSPRINHPQKHIRRIDPLSERTEASEPGETTEPNQSDCCDTEG